jgi:hypothetical protein
MAARDVAYRTVIVAILQVLTAVETYHESLQRVGESPWLSKRKANLI